MDKADIGLTIHSISIGEDLKDCLRWDVGQMVGKSKNLQISTITHDDANFSIYGVKRYLIYVIPTGAKDESLWRSYENMPISIVYDI